MDLLFSRIDFFSLSIDRLERAKTRAREIPESALKVQTNDELVATLVEEFSLRPPLIKWAEASVSRSEAQVDLMYTPNTMAYFERRSHMAPGERVRVSVPYEGDSEMFKVRPSTYTLNPPRAEVGRSTLNFDYVGQQVDVERAKQEYEAAKGGVSSYLATMTSDCGRHNQQIAPSVRTIIEEKRSRMEKGEAGLAGFGLPIKGGPR